MTEKIYCGNGKVRMGSGKNGSFSILKVSFSPDDLKKMNDWANSNNGWVNIDITKRLAPSDKGVTHTVALDTWKPDPSTQQQNVAKLQDTFNGVQSNGEVPNEQIPTEITEQLPF